MLPFVVLVENDSDINVDNHNEHPLEKLVYFEKNFSIYCFQNHSENHF